MYTMYADDKLLYDPRLFHEGYGVISPKVTVELNKAGSLNFTLPPTNNLYGKLYKMKSIITVHQNNEQIFRGRILDEDLDFYKQKIMYCEGQLAFLLDTIVRPYELLGSGTTAKNFLEDRISEHNRKVDAKRQFQVGTVGINTKITVESKDYPTTFDEINEKLIEGLNCNLMTRSVNGVEYIDLIASSSDKGTVNVSSQVIEFGTNLLDFTNHTSGGDIFTVIIPIGANGLTLTALYGYDSISNEEGIKLFGRIERVVRFDNIGGAPKLKSEAEKYLKSVIDLASSITISAIDLSILDVNVDAIHVGDWVRIVSAPHDVDKVVQCTKIVYDLANPESNEYSFGNPRSSLSGQSAKKMNKASMGGVTIISEDEGGTA